MKAIVFYELALHFNPRCAEACNNLGVIYKDRDNLDKAVECYQVSGTNNGLLFKYTCVYLFSILILLCFADGLDN
jgi:tetratricopeptide (TPR) repeat protein